MIASTARTERPNLERRLCGDCQLCCTLVPTRELNKPANTRCQHQRFRKGCAIYKDRPLPCRLWSCAWLAGEDAHDLRRPDRAGYVVDVVPDYIVAQDNDTKAEMRLAAVQVWVDPRRPTAHRDPALRAYLERRGDDGMVALIRYDSARGLILIPPQMNKNKKWREIVPVTAEEEHSLTDIIDTLREQNASVEVEIE